MALYNANVPAGVKPDDYHDLIMVGLKAESIVAQSGIAVVNTDAATLHIPRITADASAKWADEGEDLSVANPTLDEITSSPRKVGGVIRVSRELAQDSSPAATKLVGDSLTRAVAVAIDSAFFLNNGTLQPKAPRGLPAVTGFTAVSGAAANLDAFTEAQVKTLGARSQVRAWYCNSATYLRFAGIKQGTGSNVGLLETAFSINGVPVFITEDLPLNTVYGVDTAQVLLVMRDRVKVETSTDVAFSTDEVAVKVTARLDIAFPTSKAVAKLTIAA